MSTAFFYGIGLTNGIAAVTFCYDKLAARIQIRRVPERILHILEALGGVFAILLLMCIIRHKNKKITYKRITFIIALVWVASCLFLQFH